MATPNSTSSAAPNSPSNIAFHTVSDMTTCSSSSIVWDAGANTGAPFLLVVTNIGVPQTPGSARRLVVRESPVSPVNETLDVQADPSAGSFSWTKVNVPQAWYQIVAYTRTGEVKSNDFLVVNGTDTSCLAVADPSSSSGSSSPASTNTPSPTPSPSPTPGASSRSRAGAIAGGVVGGIAFLALLIALLFFCRRRSSRRAPSRKWAAEAGVKRPRSRSISKNGHGATESTGAIVSPVSNPDHGEIPIKMPKSTVSSEEDMPTGFGKRVLYSDPIRPGPIRESSTSSLRSEWRKSFSSTAIHRTPETAAPLHDRPSGRQSIDHRRSMDSTLFFQPHRQSTTSIVMSPLTEESRLPKDVDRSSSGRRASRKPVPAYNVAEFDTSNSSSSGDIGVDRQTVDTKKSQSSLFTENSDRPIHYLIPDAPPPQKRS
jgi:hypothetical protein